MGLFGSRAEAQGHNVSAARHGQAGPALRHPQRLRDDDGPVQVGGTSSGRCARRRQEDPRRRPEHPRRQRRRDRRARPGGDAGLHRYPPPPGLDGDQKLHSRRHPDRRRHGHAERAAELLRQHSARLRRPHYRPEDVYISELFGGLAQLDAGVTTVHDISQIHHSPRALGRRRPGPVRCRAARRLRLFRERRRAFIGTIPATSIHRTPPASRSSGSPRATSSSTMVMGGEVYLGDPTISWPGRSDASSACRSRPTSSRRSACARSSTPSPMARSRRRHPSGSEPTTCSST